MRACVTRIVVSLLDFRTTAILQESWHWQKKIVKKDLVKNFIVLQLHILASFKHLELWVVGVNDLLLVFS